MMANLTTEERKARTQRLLDEIDQIVPHAYVVNSAGWVDLPQPYILNTLELPSYPPARDLVPDDIVGGPTDWSSSPSHGHPDAEIWDREQAACDALGITIADMRAQRDLLELMKHEYETAVATPHPEQDWHEFELPLWPDARVPFDQDALGDEWTDSIDTSWPAATDHERHTTAEESRRHAVGVFGRMINQLNSWLVSYGSLCGPPPPYASWNDPVVKWNDPSYTWTGDEIP
jgi:hypothetical protein